jgi:hypothetical protein
MTGNFGKYEILLFVTKATKLLKVVNLSKAFKSEKFYSDLLGAVESDI